MSASPVVAEDDAVSARPVSSRAGTPRWRLARSVVLSLLVAPVTCYWAQDQGIDRIFSLMVPPVALTLVFVALNAPLRRFAPRFALSEGELIVFFAMQSVLCAMASEWLDVVAPNIYSYGLFAERNQSYQTYVLPYIRDWLFFTRPDGLQNFAGGGKPGLFWGELGLWLPKILVWTGIVSLVGFAMLCINALMRDEWVHREHLAFPIVQLPLAMVRGGGDSPFWRNRFLWIGFALMFAIDLLNGFSFLYPALPRLNVRFLGDALPWFSSPPWNQVGWTPIGVFPFLAAIGFLMPTDLLFSAVFFFFFRKAQQVVAASLGYEQGVFGGGGLVPAAPYFSEQSWGAFLGLFVTAVWVARGYLKEVWREIVTGNNPHRRAGDVPHRFAFAGLVGSILGLGGVGVAVGLPLVYVFAYTVLFLAFSIALTRLRAQLGAPTHEMAFMGPNQLIVDFHGTPGLGTPLIAQTVTTFHFMNRIHRTHPMPTMLEAVYAGERATGGPISPRGLFFALSLATVAGTLLGHLIRVYLGYRYTPADSGGETANVIATLAGTPRAPNIGAMLSVAVGFAFVLLLDFLRFRVAGFPFHPAGYALAMNFGVDYYWFGLLLVLIVKVFVQRYYGLRGYDKLRHFAFGLILGEFVAETIWAAFSMLNDRQATYSISINGKLGWNQ